MENMENNNLGEVSEIQSPEMQIESLKKKNEDLVQRSIKKITELNEKIKQLQSKNKIELYRAIATLQRSVKVTKNGVIKATFGNIKYFKLEDMLVAIEPFLEKLDLMVLQGPVNGTYVKTEIIHLTTGQKTEPYILKVVDSKNPDPCKAQGGGVTYSKKYSLGSLLGLVDAEDPDSK